MSFLSRRWLWLLLLPLILWSALRLEFDTEVLNLLPPESPAVHGLKLYQQHFSSARELVIALSAPNAEEAELAAGALAELLTETNLISQVTWRPPWLEHPKQAAELSAYLWLNQPPGIFGALTNRLLGPQVTETLIEAREQLAASFSPAEIGQLSYDPFNLLTPPVGDEFDRPEQSESFFASADGSFRIIMVRAADELPDYRACERWLRSVKETVESARAAGLISPEVIINYTGRPAFMTEIARGMGKDIKYSMLGTLAVILLLFWWVHRSWLPLLWLGALLALLLASTLALGGFLLGALNGVSAGFAAILLGLAVDYALVLYQEHRAAPERSVARIRRSVGPSIVWSAATTAGAFSILNFGGLPGLGQLGSLVALGVVLAAATILYGFLPPLVRASRKGSRSVPEPVSSGALSRFVAPRAVWGVSLLLIGSALAILWFQPPVLDRSPDPLRPHQSAAYATVEQIKAKLQHPNEPHWLVVEGKDDREMAGKLDQILPVLERARDDGAIASFMLPAGLWPHPEFQAANRAIARQLLEGQDQLRKAVLDQGFTAEALDATETIYAAWQQAIATDGVFHPDNELSRWFFDKFSARSEEKLLALGLVYPPDEAKDAAAHRVSEEAPALEHRPEWARDLPDDGVWLAGWDLLGSTVLEIVRRDIWRVLIPIFVLLLISLWLAFRRTTEIALSLATVALSIVCLQAFMSLVGWSWNLLNLMALPLLLGAGIDYSLHVQMALRRHHGSIARLRQTIGRALFLCAATTMAGFGSLTWSSNAGLASLGQVCATGIAFTFVIAVLLLPVWWRSLTMAPSSKSLAKSASEQSPVAGLQTPEVHAPSSWYRSKIWRVGVLAATVLPAGGALQLGRWLGVVYWSLNRRRRQTVVQNLLPAVDGNDLHKARALSRELFRQFACKLVDLWRYESGLPIDHLLENWQGWERLAQAQSSGRGVLLLTPHLGNWELGAPFLARRGVKLLVLTVQEPDPELTEARRASRARWGVETLVISQDPFAFLEVIRRLEAGATVALLTDRPPPSSAATVEMFGRPFAASMAAAELARATGCALFPVYVVRAAEGYRAAVLPEVSYDRAKLGSRAAREQLTQEIMRVFEPIIQKYLTQWYHFIPIWPLADRSIPPNPNIKQTSSALWPRQS
jgi:uncharacterized protein